jgi:hypothetical protein
MGNRATGDRTTGDRATAGQGAKGDRGKRGQGQKGTGAQGDRGNSGCRSTYSLKWYKNKYVYKISNKNPLVEKNNNTYSIMDLFSML